MNPDLAALEQLAFELFAAGFVEHVGPEVVPAGHDAETHWRENLNNADLRAWNAIAAHVQQRLESLAAEVERLTKERDEAREKTQKWADVQLMTAAALERAQAHVALLWEAIDELPARGHSHAPHAADVSPCPACNALAATDADAQAFLAGVRNEARQEGRAAAHRNMGTAWMRCGHFEIDLARDEETGEQVCEGCQREKRVRRDAYEKAARYAEKYQISVIGPATGGQNLTAWSIAQGIRALADAKEEPGVRTAAASQSFEEARDGGEVAPSESPSPAAPGLLPGAPEAPK